MMEINLRLYLTTFPCNSIEVLATIKIFMPTTVPIRKNIFFRLVISPFRISWVHVLIFTAFETGCL
uniref:Uncharacterized protein n=1 Tax=Ursus maritimus TaxID=29073 RepID=A0A452THT0_URSMA